jgi:hypothetical protein
MNKYDLYEKLKNLVKKTQELSRHDRLSWCLHCRKTWDNVVYQPIQFSVKLPAIGGSGMFPICKVCFKELSSDEIFGYCKELFDDWIKKGSKLDDTIDFDVDTVDFDVIRYNIDYLKKEK